ncbi:hypothetical protein BGZ83_004338 [Gryganskiella cystojenkinii]|nr:hypothetical protein BGZ83_004338 [Gryganskiella cystojenkinii]
MSELYHVDDNNVKDKPRPLYDRPTLGWRSMPDSEVRASLGSKKNFMLSYGLRLDPDGFEEARAILDTFKQGNWCDRTQDRGESQNSNLQSDEDEEQVDNNQDEDDHDDDEGKSDDDDDNSNGRNSSGGRNNNGGGGSHGQDWQSIPDSKIYESWGGKMQFMHSYGLKPTPEGFEEARAITDAFKQDDWANRQESSGGRDSGRR